MDDRQAGERLLEAIPEFASWYAKSIGNPGYDDGGELLLHAVMGDLARFYMARARRDEELAAGPTPVPAQGKRQRRLPVGGPGASSEKFRAWTTDRHGAWRRWGAP